MSCINTFDLNIGKQCLDNWKNKHAIREIIANAIDEHTHSNIKKPIDINYNRRSIEIIDYGRGLNSNSFIHQTNSVKKHNKKYIGFFGIGLKDSIGVLCKNDVDVIIYTKKYKYEPEYKNLKNRDITLHINEYKNEEYYGNNYGTKIVLHNISKKDVDDAKMYFLNYSPNKYDTLYKYNNGNDKIIEYDKKQIIYVNGLKVCETNELYFSYNLEKNDNIMEILNRDREEKELKHFKKNIQSILENIDIFDEKLSNDKFIKKIINILSENNLKEFNKKKIIIYIISQLNNTDKYIFIDKKDEKKAKIAKYKNKIINSKREIIFIGEGLINKINSGNKNKIQNIRELYNDILFDKKYLYTWWSLFPPDNIEPVKKKIIDLLEKIQKDFNIDIPKSVEKTLSNIELIDDEDDNNSDSDSDSDDDNNSNDSYNSDDSDDNNKDKYIKNKLEYKGENYLIKNGIFKIKSDLLSNAKSKELKAIIMTYILDNINSSERIKIIGELIKDNNTSWLQWNIFR